MEDWEISIQLVLGTGALFGKVFFLKLHRVREWDVYALFKCTSHIQCTSKENVTYVEIHWEYHLQILAETQIYFGPKLDPWPERGKYFPLFSNVGTWIWLSCHICVIVSGPMFEALHPCQVYLMKMIVCISKLLKLVWKGTELVMCDSVYAPASEILQYLQHFKSRIDNQSKQIFLYINMVCL